VLQLKFQVQEGEIQAVLVQMVMQEMLVVVVLVHLEILILVLLAILEILIPAILAILDQMELHHLLLE
jgi:hypothetical protein